MPTTNFNIPENPNMIRAFLISVIFLICLRGNAQNLPNYVQYQEYYGLINPSSINPDFLAINIGDWGFSANATSRHNWIKKEFPTTHTAFASFEYISVFSNSLFDGGFIGGLSTFKDRVGSFENLGGYLRSSFYFGDFKNGKSWIIGGGFNLGINQKRIVSSALGTIDQNDKVLLDAVGRSSSSIDIGLGVYALKRFGNNSFYAGVSVPQQMISASIKESEEDSFDFFRRNQLSQIYLYTGSTIMCGEGEDRFLDISLWAISNPWSKPNLDNLFIPTFLSIILKYKFSREFWIGFGIDTNGYLNMNSGVYIPLESYGSNYIKLGFSYGFSGLSRFLGDSDVGGNLEFNVGYFLGE